MLPTIGLIVAAYAMARLIQIPIENLPPEWDYRWVVLAVISVPAIGFIALASFALVSAGMQN